MASFDDRIVNGIGALSAIVDSGTFATAGEVLNMSPSGVSRSIARLEARLVEPTCARSRLRTLRAKLEAALADVARFSSINETLHQEVAILQASAPGTAVAFRESPLEANCSVPKIC